MPDEEKKRIWGTEKLTYSYLYEHAQARGNLFRCFAMEGCKSALLVSERCEVLEELLEEKCQMLTVITPEEWERKEGFLTEAFDVVFHLGVVSCKGIGAAGAYQKRLKRYKELLSEDGELFLAGSNRLGLKYFAGCQDDSYETYFAGPEGYSREMKKQALSRKEYEKALKGAGFEDVTCYYPYPDYLFPMMLYSDEYLPGTGELTRNIRNFDKDRYVFFDEGRVFDTLVQEGLFREFSNSFLFRGRKAAQKEENRFKVVYSRCSNERDERFRIRTDIIVDAGLKKAVKYALTPEAEEHIRKMEEHYHGLARAAEGTRAVYCPVSLHHGGAVFEWVNGISLQQKLQSYLDGGQGEAADGLILEYIELVKRLAPAEIVDVDLIFPNILIEGDQWNIIDYEWTFEKPVPAEWVIYRALFHASIELAGYESMDLQRLLALAGISEQEAMRYEKGEMKFQAYLAGDTIPIHKMVELLGREVIPFQAGRKAEEKEAERLLNRKEKDAKKLFFHLDRVEKEDGKGVLCGWACARTKDHEFIPVHIAVFDQYGNPVPKPIERHERKDAATALNAGEGAAPWGFSISFGLRPDREYTVRFSAGRCQEEIRLQVMN